MSEQFRCTIKHMFRNCPKPSGWFGCFATANKGLGEIMIKGTVSFIPTEGMTLTVEAEQDTDGSWNIIQAEPYTKTQRAMVNYLSGPNFKGIGYAKASILVNMYGNTLADAVKNTPDIVQKAAKLTDAQIETLKIGLNSDSSRIKQRFPMLSDKLIKTMLKTDVQIIQQIEIDPYKIQEKYAEHGFTFDMADTIAIDILNWNLDDPKRIKKHFRYTTRKWLNNTGNCYVNLSDDPQYRNYKTLFEENLRMRYDDTIFYQTVKDEAESTDNEIVLVHYKNTEWHLYTLDSYNAKETIKKVINICKNKSATNYHKLTQFCYNYLNSKTASAQIVLKKAIADIKNQQMKQNGYCMDTEQENAVMTAMNTQLSILTGGPGRGKTATINNICSVWKNAFPNPKYRFINGKKTPDYKITLLAPTGRAAANMTDYTGLKAQTIAKAKIDYEIHKDNSEIMQSDGLCIIDECSMVGMEDMAKILQIACAQNNQILLVGDVDQLPSINYGAPFADLIKSDKVPVSRLITCHRSDIKVISDNADKILAGDRQLGWTPNFMFLHESDEAKCANLLMQSYLQALHDNPSNQVVLLSAVHGGDCGTDAMNITLQNTLNPRNIYAQSRMDSLRDRPYVKDNGYEIQETYFAQNAENWTRLRIGDRVMRTDNDNGIICHIREDNDIDKQILEVVPGVVNGDCGTIIRYYPYKDKDNPAIICVRFDDNRICELETDPTESNSAKLTLAYAMTFHKTQGCEYNNVLIAVLDRVKKIPNNFANRNMLYTPVTRAKKKVLIIGQTEGLYYFIDTPANVRNSTLAEEL